MDMDRKLTNALQAAMAMGLSRREFFKLAGKGLGMAALAGTLPACGGGSDDDESTADPAIPAPSPEYTVLRRTSFGAHRDQLNQIETIGIEAYLEQQLDYQTIDDGDLESTLQTLFPLVYQTPAELISGFPDNIGNIALQMTGAAQYRQIFSQRQLYEVMVEFWSDHFNIHLLNGLGPTLKPQDDLQVIRQHALGNFRDLLYASARSPAMLFYLDNFFNLASAPNENYARELMELHTLGVDGGYNEQDVQEVARCFTGWTLNFPDDAPAAYGSFSYEDGYHDKGVKVVLAQTIAAGGDISDGEQVLDLLIAHPSTARFIATKLCRRFISDTPEVASVDAVANAFSLSQGDIKDTLRALFASDEFLDTYDQKFTRPSEYLAGLVRALAPDTNYPTDDGQLFFFAQSILGQLPYNWPTPDGYPDRRDYWASTGGLLNRWRLSFISFAAFIAEIDVIQIDYGPMLGGANTLATILDRLVQQILMRPLSEHDRSLLLNWLTEEYTVDEDTELLADAINATAALISAVLLSSAYFQLR